MSLQDSNRILRPDDDAPTPPKWREDFPYETEGDEYITRRDFTRFLCIISAGFATGNGWIFWRSMREISESLPRQEICRTTDLQPGQWRVFNYPDEKTPAMLIHRMNGEFIAYMQKCTHLSCPVQYEHYGESGEALTCHCHNGTFDIRTGEGVSGPPREFRPLPRVALQIEGDRIFAAGLAHKEEFRRT
jgi:nitrite reductase/ring-hydroxylating ferredoxin subunit